jgi:hypothetical protein
MVFNIFILNRLEYKGDEYDGSKNKVLIWYEILRIWF